jgi:mRNA interferase MazF
MREGAIVLLALRQADGKVKPRPAVALRQLPGFGDWLVCGVSRQLHQYAAGFDEQVAASDADFDRSGLSGPSLIRLGFLQSVPLSSIMGGIGAISPDRHRRLLTNLSRHLAP